MGDFGHAERGADREGLGRTDRKMFGLVERTRGLGRWARWEWDSGAVEPVNNPWAAEDASGSAGGRGGRGGRGERGS